MSAVVRFYPWPKKIHYIKLRSIKEMYVIANHMMGVQLSPQLKVICLIGEMVDALVSKTNSLIEYQFKSDIRQ